MATLTPAAELAARSRPYPNDSADYRAVRTALLAEEIALRRHIERVAAQRRALPLGGAAPDYSFIDENGKTVKLADLFGRHDTLVTYFWMYGPQRERPCPMCTAFLGAIDIPSRAGRHRRSRPGSARRAGPDTAVEYPGLDAGRTRHGLVSEVILLKQRRAGGFA